MAKGMGSVKQAVNDHKAEYGSGGFIRYLRLDDGETVELTFLGTPANEPNTVHEHSMRKGKMFKTVRCRKEKCPACYANTNGDARVGKPSLKGYFSVYDPRWSKKTRDKERSNKDGKDRFKFEPIDESEVTKKGIAKGLFVRRGKCVLALSGQWLVALDTQNSLAGRRCMCGGKITVDGYSIDGKTANKRAAKMDEDELAEAVNSGKIDEELSCSKCDEPKRRSIFNSTVQVTRSGVQTNTSYQFAITGDETPDEVKEAMEEEKVEAYDLDELLKPLSASALAREIGVRNPWAKKGEDEDAEDYDDDDSDDEDEELDEDDDLFGEDDDDKPKKKNKKKSKKSRDDDEEDEEEEEEDDDDSDDEDEDEDEEEAPRRKSKVKVKLRR